MISIKKNYSGETLLIAIAVIVLLISIIINLTNAELRMIEIHNSLSPSSSYTQDADHSALIIQYRLRMELYNGKIDRFNADIAELQASSMLPSLWTIKKEEPGILTRTGAVIINSLKRFLGKPPISFDNKDGSNFYLESAYFYERNNLFIKAIEKYDMALNVESDPVRQAGIMIHGGYCISMKGNTRQAKNIYRQIIEKFPDLPVSITASVLLDLLEGISREADKVRLMPDSLKKGESLFNLIAFEDSLGVIKKLERSSGAKSSPSLLLYKGKCLESLGKARDALRIYQKLIIENSQSIPAGEANRRILAMSIKAGRNSEGAQLAIRNNELIKDKRFMKFMKETDKIKRTIPDRLKVHQPLNTSLLNEKSQLIDEKLKKFRFHLKNRRVKITTMQGDKIIGFCTGETEKTITIRTIAGTAVIRRHMIRKSEIK